jgi:restriction endonuclease Mrr
VDAHSDIANLAMAFAQQRKRDHKTGINYVTMIVENSKDPTALFLARRLLGVLLVQSKRAAEGVKVLEDLLAHARANEMTEEIGLILYDLGFAALSAELTDLAYEYWNQLYQHDRNYRNIQTLVTSLRREMDADIRSGSRPAEGSVADLIEEWQENAFPDNFLWNICGLRSERKIDLKKVTVTARVAAADRDEGGAGASAPAVEMSGDATEALARFSSLEPENFRIIANRVVGRLGYRVDEILTTYREADGVDYLAVPTGEKARILVAVRRWKSNIGEIPLRNFAQAVNDMKAREGLFITASELTETAETALPRIGRVRVVKPDELGDLLVGLL